MKDNLTKTKWFIFGTYILLILATLLIGFVLLQNNSTLRNVFKSFFEVAENRTFDYRQSIKVNKANTLLPNKDIVLLAIDDASVEYLWDKYGEWPIPRNIYADVINYIEAQKPQAIIFDLMFIKSVRSQKDADKYFIDTMNKYNNIYTGLNFDNQEVDVRKPENLPDRIALNIDNKSSVNFKQKYNFANCRLILPELLNGNVQVGLTNVKRSNDGIIRSVSPVVVYKDKNYPYLSFKAGSDYLRMKQDNSFTIDSNRNLLVADTKIPLNKYGEAVLNWYGPSGTHTNVPFYKIINEIEGKNINKFDFKDKIIIV